MWREFVEFTQNQILELSTNYGKIDILWFDAGWVCEKSGQDIGLGEVIDRVRKFQPWILSSDRTLGDPYENYVTPEQCVPDKPMDIPWEICITMGTSFSSKYEDKYKTPRELVNLLIDVVAKGGNLALNVGPQPDGRIPTGAIECMKGLGEWMKLYGDAIYGTRVCAPYYAFRMYPDKDEPIDEKIRISYSGNINKVTMMDTGQLVNFEKVDGKYVLSLPEDYSNKTPLAHVFKII